MWLVMFGVLGHIDFSGHFATHNPGMLYQTYFSPKLVAKVDQPFQAKMSSYPSPQAHRRIQAIHTGYFGQGVPPR